MLIFSLVRKAAINPTGGASDYLHFVLIWLQKHWGRGENRADKRAIVLQVSDIDVGFASNTELITEPWLSYK